MIRTKSVLLFINLLMSLFIIRFFFHRWIYFLLYFHSFVTPQKLTLKTKSLNEQVCLSLNLRIIEVYIASCECFIILNSFISPIANCTPPRFIIACDILLWTRRDYLSSNAAPTYAIGIIIPIRHEFQLS